MKINLKKMSVAGLGSALLLAAAAVVFSQQPQGPRPGPPPGGFRGGPGVPGGPPDFGPRGPGGPDFGPVVREVRAGRRKALDRADPADLKVLDLSDRWAAI